MDKTVFTRDHKQPRDSQIGLRLSEQEKRLVDDMAAARGLKSRERFLRELLQEAWQKWAEVD